MTTLRQAEEAIAQAVVDAWAPTGHPIALQNEKFDRPNRSPWARFSLQINLATQETLGRAGNRRFLRQGAAFVQIFVPQDEGTGQSNDLVKVVTDALEGARITGTTVRFNDVIPRRAPGAEGKWFGQLVEARFEFDERR